jgi:hypothetical protein
MKKYLVLSLRKGKEHRSPWFHSMAHARTALDIIRAKGFLAIIYVD